MFGIGAQEMVIIGLLCLLVFGPGKLSVMARDVGGFVRKARESVDEFKAELEVDGGHEAAWEDPDEYQEGTWEDEQPELREAPEFLEHGAGDASPPLERNERAPEWIPAPVTYPDLEEGPRSERKVTVPTRDAAGPASDPAGA